MTTTFMEAEVDTRTAGERLSAIWEGLGETAIGLSPRRELEATMAAIVLANDPLADISRVTLDDLQYELHAVDVATEEQLC